MIYQHYYLGNTLPKQSIQAFTQRNGPVRYLKTENRLYLGLVQNRISGTLHRTWKLVAMTRPYIAIRMTGILCYHFSKVIPAAYSFVGIMVDAGVWVGDSSTALGTTDMILIVFKDNSYCPGKVQRVCRHKILIGFLGNSIATIIAIFVGVMVYGICVLKIKMLSKEDYLMIPKGEKIAKVLEKLHLLR